MKKPLQRKVELSQILPIMVALFVGLLAIILWQALNVREDAQIKLAVEEKALTLQAEIRERIEPRILSLVRMAKRWELRGGTPHEEWEADAMNHINNQTGQRAITWVDSSYISRWMVASDERRRSNYTGLNLAIEEKRRVALEEARETREIRVTRASNMFGGEEGILVFVPLFVGDRFDGYIQGVFRIQQLLNPLLSEHASLGYSISVFEGDEEITKSTVANRPANAEWIEETEVEIRNVTWRIRVWPTPELVAIMRSLLPEAALGTGLLLALLMSLTIRLAQKANLRARDVGSVNQDLQEQIAERKRAEEEIQTLNEELEQRVQDRTAQLQRSEEKFRGLLESAPDAIVGVGSNGRMVLVNAQTEKLFGYTREELLGKPIEILLPGCFPQKHVNHRKNYNSNPRTRLMGDGLELAGHRKDGSKFSVEISLSPMETEEGPMVTAIIRDVTSRKQTQEALRASEDRFRAQYKGLPVPTLTWQRVGEDFLLIDHNDVSLVISRGQIPNFIGKTASDFYNDRPDLLDDMWRCFREKAPIKRETPFRMRATGEEKYIAFTYAFIPPNLVMTHAEDITERKQMAEALQEKEEQLRHAQKMEAIGQLAGGVAHDFNNLLTGIIGYSDLLMKKLGPDHPLLKQAGQIKKAGDQAAVLTGQLLAFSRKQVLQPQVVDLNEIVTGIDEMLRRSVGDNITLVTSLSPALGKTKADPSQIEQVILNLVSNACDAMPDGGTLTIATENIERKQANGYPGSETIAKRHVMLTVSDTGCGMDRGTLAHIFEPFFTTKEVGKGTGLGLASVYGVVQQSGGHIQVSSESGRGTKFQIYLSQVDKTLPSPKPDAIQPVPSGGWETILLVEDSDPVRELLFQCLQDEGYTVLAASQSAEAIQIAEKKQQKIDMLLTDVIMPGMSGPDLAQIILKDHKDIKVLYLSGYSDHPLVLQGTSKPNISFLAKPFNPEILMRKVREVLNAPKGKRWQRESLRKQPRNQSRSELV